MDLTSDLTNPIIYRNSVDDSVATSYMTSILDRLGKTYTVSDAPAISDYTSLDSLIAGRDTIVIGGPIVNRMAHDMQGNWLYFDPNRGGLYPSLNAAGGTEITFSAQAFFDTPPGLDGTKLSPEPATPDVLFWDSTISLDRFSRADSSGTITDHAVVVLLRGGTNNLLYVAGVRDFGTLAGLFLLDWTSNNAGSWPYGAPNPVSAWQTYFSTHDIALVRFTYSDTLNTVTASAFKTELDTNGLRPTIVEAP